MNTYKSFLGLIRMKKMAVPHDSYETHPLLNERRPFPSLDCLNETQLTEVRKRISNIIDYHSHSKLAFQAVDYFAEALSKLDFKEENCFEDSNSNDNKIFYKDPWNQSSMIAFIRGKKPISEGFRIIAAHADSPCLRIKPRPIRMEEKDTSKFYHYLGARLSAIPHGGVLYAHWIGQPVKVMGYTINKDRTKKEISFPAFVGINSAHVEANDMQTMREFSPDSTLEIITGHNGPKDLLKSLHLESLDDFATTRLWAVPTNEMQLLNEEFPNLLVGYGHDNRTTAYSAVDALTEVKNPTYASFVWVSDNEEIFDPAPVGTKGNFLEMIVEKLIEEQEKKEKRKISTTEKNLLFRKSRFIIADSTFAPYGPDVGEATDVKSASKIGLGVAIEGGDIQGYDPVFLRDLRNLTEPIPEKRLGICHQVTGDFYNQDEMPLWLTWGQPYFPKTKGTSGSWVAIPCACLHSSVEAICPGDEYAAFNLYKRFFESDVSALS
jgi:aspartyl aminopeptidase